MLCCVCEQGADDSGTGQFIWGKKAMLLPFYINSCLPCFYKGMVPHWTLSIALLFCYAGLLTFDNLPCCTCFCTNVLLPFAPAILPASLLAGVSLVMHSNAAARLKRAGKGGKAWYQQCSYKWVGLLVRCLSYLFLNDQGTDHARLRQHKICCTCESTLTCAMYQRLAASLIQHPVYRIAYSNIGMCQQHYFLVL